VRDAQRGSSDASRALYTLVGDDAEDVASGTWLQVARDLASFTGDRDGFRCRVTTIGRHRALDHLRHRGRRPPPAPVPAEELADLAADDTAAGAIEAISTGAANRLIATLPPDRAEVTVPLAARAA
jgi:RNA polymerase sigma-70 factor (ECF subfamily)